MKTRSGFKSSQDYKELEVFIGEMKKMNAASYLEIGARQ